jgi:hypothetical protein
LHKVYLYQSDDVFKIIYPSVDMAERSRLSASDADGRRSAGIAGRVGVVGCAQNQHLTGGTAATE